MVKGGERGVGSVIVQDLWGQRSEKGGAGRELVDETVSQSAASCPKDPHSPPRGQAEEAVDGMSGVTRTAECFAGQACVVDVPDGGKGGTDDLFSCSHYAL